VHLSLRRVQEEPERQAAQAEKEPQRQRQPSCRHRGRSRLGPPSTLGDCAGARQAWWFGGVGWWPRALGKRTDNPNPVSLFPLLKLEFHAQIRLLHRRCRDLAHRRWFGCCLRILNALGPFPSEKPGIALDCLSPSSPHHKVGCADHRPDGLAPEEVGVHAYTVPTKSPSHWSCPGVKTVGARLPKVGLSMVAGGLWIRTPHITGPRQIGGAGSALGKISFGTSAQRAGKPESLRCFPLGNDLQYAFTVQRRTRLQPTRMELHRL